MPPRHAYWTILIDDKPTAFRAREREELLPTLNQLKRTNANAVMQWFAHGRLWETQEKEREDFQRRKHASARPFDRRDAKPPASAPVGDEGSPQERERRGKDWRPGGAHKDPRDRFKKKNRPDRAWTDKPDRETPRSDRPWSNKPSGPPRGDRPWTNKPSGPPRGDRPWTNKPSGPPRGDRPWTNKPSGPPRGDRPWSNKPSGPPRSDRPWTNKPSAPPRGDRPWNNKPSGPPRGDRPWSNKPHAGGKRPWSGKPHGGNQPWRDRPRTDRRPPDRRDADAPTRRQNEPSPPPAAEQIRTKPKPPERG